MSDNHFQSDRYNQQGPGNEQNSKRKGGCLIPFIVAAGIIGGGTAMWYFAPTGDGGKEPAATRVPTLPVKAHNKVPAAAYIVK